MKTMTRRSIPVFFLLAAALAWGQAQEATLNFDPAQTTVNFTLGDVLHTVHGSFRLKTGQVRFDPATNSISGELVVDAPSGNSGSTGRDRKMHKEILQSVRYPEVTFRPDRVDGKVLASGRSAVQVHGMFGILGVEHEITVPARLNSRPIIGVWRSTSRCPT